MSNFGAFGMVLTGSAINTIHTVEKNHDPFPTLLAGGMFAGACVMLNGLNPRLGTSLAAVFLLGSFLTNGADVIGIAGKTVAGAQAYTRNGPLFKAAAPKVTPYNPNIYNAPPAQTSPLPSGPNSWLGLYGVTHP